MPNSAQTTRTQPTDSLPSFDSELTRMRALPVGQLASVDTCNTAVISDNGLTWCVLSVLLIGEVALTVGKLARARLSDTYWARSGSGAVA